MVIHHQFTKLIFALRRGLIKINPLYDPDLFLNNRLLGFRPRRSGVKCGRGYIKRSKHIRTIGIATSSLLVLLTALAVFPITHHDDSTEATAVPATTTLTMTSSSTTASVDVTPISSNGTFAASESANDIAFTVTTNNVTGYNLTIAGSDDTRKLVNGDAGGASSNATLDSITTATSTADFTSGSASTYSNKWGYKPSMYNSASNTNYLPAPTTTEETLNHTTKPNTAADNYTIGLGTRVDYTKPTGTYTNTFILTAVGNPISYQINYKDNTGTSGTTGSDVTNLPSSEGASDITASSFILSSTTPQRTGYSFNKWCDGTVTHVNHGNSTCSGKTYAAGATYNFTTLSTSSINTANLYAMWNVKTYSLSITFAGSGVSNVQVRTASGTGGTLKGTVSTSGGSVSGLTYGVAYYLKPTFSSNYKLDSWAKTSSFGTLSSTSSTNPTFTMGAGNGAVKITGKSSKLYMQDMDATQCTTAGVTAYDRRDEKAYTIKKLADGKCWMTENLRLDLSTVSLSTLQGTTSAPNTNANNTTLTYLKNGGGSSPYPANGVIAKTASSGSWAEDYTNPYIATQYKDTTQPASGSSPAGKIGIYYNYCAASAGSYCYASGAGTGDASQDICPSGWRMPTGGASGEYQALYTAYSSNIANFQAALSTPLSGGFYGGAAYNRGTYGVFWSSTRSDGIHMYDLYVGSSTVDPQDSNRRHIGYSVRCVLK